MINQAFRDWLRTNTFFPKPADILHLIGIYRRRAHEAYLAQQEQENKLTPEQQEECAREYKGFLEDVRKIIGKFDGKKGA